MILKPHALLFLSLSLPATGEQMFDPPPLFLSLTTNDHRGQASSIMDATTHTSSKVMGIGTELQNLIDTQPQLLIDTNLSALLKHLRFSGTRLYLCMFPGQLVMPIQPAVSSFFFLWRRLMMRQNAKLAVAREINLDGVAATSLFPLCKVFSLVEDQDCLSPFKLNVVRQLLEIQLLLLSSLAAWKQGVGGLSTLPLPTMFS